MRAAGVSENFCERHRGKTVRAEHKSDVEFGKELEIPPSKSDDRPSTWLLSSPSYDAIATDDSDGLISLAGEGQSVSLRSARRSIGFLEMSRKSRRKKPVGTENPWLVKAIIITMLVCVFTLGASYIALRIYLHGDSFRKFLSGEVSKAAGVHGEFATFNWEGLAANTASFEATGDGAVTYLRADGLHTEVGLGGLSRGVWEIKGSRLQRLEMTIDATRSADQVKAVVENVIQDVKRNTPESHWLPRDAELDGLDIEDVTVNATLAQGPVAAKGLNLHLEPAGAKNSYRAEIRDGTIQLPFKILPEIQIDSVRARYQEKHVYLTDASLKAWDQGQIEGSGEWDMRTRQFSMDGTASGIKCTDLSSADWTKRVTGNISSTFSMNNSSGTPVANGKLTVRDTVITAMPILDMLAAYANTSRFRVLSLNEAHTDWRWQRGRLLLTNLVLSCDGLVRLEGSLDIKGGETDGKDRLLDGTFKLGLAPGTLSNIPGAETDVFIAGDRGLLWATIHVSGTLGKPVEDLTDRLIAAAGLRILDQLPGAGEKVLKLSHAVLGDHSDKTIKKGMEILQKNSGVISGVLEGILGSSTPSVDPVVEPVIDPNEKPVEKPVDDKK
jgi:hypothetical protein